MTRACHSPTFPNNIIYKPTFIHYTYNNTYLKSDLQLQEQMNSIVWYFILLSYRSIGLKMLKFFDFDNKIIFFSFRSSHQTQFHVGGYYVPSVWCINPSAILKWEYFSYLFHVRRYHLFWWLSIIHFGLQWISRRSKIKGHQLSWPCTFLTGSNLGPTAFGALSLVTNLINLIGLVMILCWFSKTYVTRSEEAQLILTASDLLGRFLVQ